MNVKKIMQLSTLVGVTVCLLGCGTSQNYATAVNSWQGAPKTALMNDWGSPAIEKTLANGNTLYMYRVVETEKFTKTYNPVVATGRVSPQPQTNMLSHAPAVMHGQDETFWCETQFEVNKAGMIVNSSFTGNNCVASKERAQRLAFTH
jgi:hypothetical protein